MLGENDCRIKHSPYISSSRVRPASSVVSPRSLLWNLIIFSCKCSLPYICCCLVNELLHNSCMPTSKEQSQSLMFYRTVIKADSGWFHYFCVWSASPKTSLLIKDNSRKNSHIRLRAKSELIPLLIVQFLKVNFSNVVSSACTFMWSSCFVWESLFSVLHSAAFSINEVSLKKNDCVSSGDPKAVTCRGKD